MSNISHAERGPTLESVVERIRQKVIARKDLPHASVEEQLNSLDLLLGFEFGRFLLLHGGLNGYWTEYINSYPDLKPPLKHPGDIFFLTRAPICLAMQERYRVFRKELQSRLKPGATFASVPCGQMSDLLDLDFSSCPNVQLVGIDLEEETLTQAKQRAAGKNLSVQFLQRDAWNLGINNTFDLLTCNGLSFYEPNDDKVTELYKELRKALKPGGILLTSFLTPPHEWRRENVNPADIRMQRIFLSDLVESRWQTFRAEEQVKGALLTAGFKNLNLIYDRAHIFPTITCQK